MERKERIGVQITTRGRNDYLACLLESLRHQTWKAWDLFIVDNNENNKITESPLVTAFFERINFEGHRIKVVNNTSIRDIGALRNIALDMDDCEFGLRIDDDSIIEPEYLELLHYVFTKEEKAGAVQGIYPVFYGEKEYTPVPPIFNRIDEFYSAYVDIWKFYNTDKFAYFPAHHLSSTFMYRNKIAKKIRHPEDYGMTGFREETDFSLRFNLKYKNFVIPSAVAWHLPARTGGGREAYTGLDSSVSDLRWNNDHKLRERMKKLRVYEKIHNIG